METENIRNFSSFPPPTQCSGTTPVEQDLLSTRSDLQSHYHPFRSLTESLWQLVLMGSATPSAPCAKSLSGTIFLILVLTKIGRKKRWSNTQFINIPWFTLPHVNFNPLIRYLQSQNNILSLCEFSTMEKLQRFIIDCTPYLGPVLVLYVATKYVCYHLSDTNIGRTKIRKEPMLDTWTKLLVWTSGMQKLRTCMMQWFR